MNRKWNYGLIILMVIVFSTFVGYRSFATNYDAKVAQVEKKKAELLAKKKALQSEIASLEANRKDVISYVSKLNTKIDDISATVSSLEGQMIKKKKSLAITKKQLTAAANSEKEQYSTMKMRIKYMYENGNSEYLDMVFSAKNVSDLLNRAEYIEKISEYDNNMLVRLKKTRASILQKKEQIQDALDDLSDLQEETIAQKDALLQINRNKQAELGRYNTAIASSVAAKSKYNSEVAKQEAAIENILIAKQKAIEEARKKAQEANGGSDATDKYTGTSGMRWPLRVSGRISSTFGYRDSPTAGASSYHKGIDIAVSSGTPIVAVADGEVVIATYSSSAGNYIMINHGKSTYTVYMHCSGLSVGVGDAVKKGQTIGQVGSTGISTGAHLHFGITINGSYVNPLNYVKQ